MLNHPRTRPTNRASFRVLVVDDNDRHRAVIAEALARCWPFDRQLQVIWARHAAEALARLREQRISLLLINHHASPRDGAAVLRHLRDHGVDIPAVVVVAGLQSPELIAELKSLAAAHLPRWEMDKLTFHDAIGNSLRLLGRLPSDTQPITSG